MIVTKFEHCRSSLLWAIFLANICPFFFYHWWGVLSMFPSILHFSQKQSHYKKWLSNLGSLKCNWDLNHTLDMFAKEKERKLSTRIVKNVLKIIDKYIKSKKCMINEIQSWYLTKYIYLMECTKNKKTIIHEFENMKFNLQHHLNLTFDSMATCICEAC